MDSSGQFTETAQRVNRDDWTGQDHIPSLAPEVLTWVQPLLDALPSMAAVWHTDGQIGAQNALWQHFFGDRNAVWLQSFYALDLTAFQDLLLSQDSAQPLPQIECRIRNRLDRYEWFALTARPLALPIVSADRAVLITAFPIDRYKSREEDMDASAVMKRNMLNASIDCIKVVTPEGYLKDMNRAGCLALGVPEGSDFGMTWLSLLPPEVYDLGKAALAQARMGASARFPGKSQIPGQLPQYWDNLLTPVMDGAGQVIEIACVSREVTAERVAEQELRIVREGLELAAQAAKLGIFEIRPQEGRFSWDKRCAELLGQSDYSPPSYESSFLSRIHPDDCEATDQAIRNALYPTGSGAFDCEFRAIGPDGFTVSSILASGVCLFDDGKPWRMIGALQDVTADRNIRRKLHETGDKLKAALDLQQLLTGEMQHRIKNLFTVVSGLISLAEREMRDSDNPNSVMRQLRDRVVATARATDLLVKPVDSDARVMVIDPVALSRTVLTPYLGRFITEGTVAPVDRQWMNPLVLLIHELSTNALKYGAFSQSSGRVLLRWQEKGDQLILTWSETGGPEILGPPVGLGFGSAMIEDVVTLSGGTLNFDWQPRGLVVTAVFPTALSIENRPG